MVNEKCKGDWRSTLNRKIPKPKPGENPNDKEGVITISESAGKLIGKHADSDDFPVTCDGTNISFTRTAKSKNKLIVYSGSFTSDKEIHGTYTRTDTSNAARTKRQAALAGDSGDWEATKPPTLLETKQQMT